VTPEDGPSTVPVQTDSIEVDDLAVVPTGVTLTPVEGQQFTNQTVATFTDPGGDEPLYEYSAAINWGDNITSAGTITGPDGNGVYTVTGSHTYAEESAPEHSGSFPYYNVTVTINHGPNGLLLAADNEDDTVVVIDTASDTVLGSADLPGGGAALQTEITPDGTLGFVTDGTNAVYPVDLSTPSTPVIETAIPLSGGFSADDMSITPDGKFLLVTDQSNGNDTIAVIDTADLAAGATYFTSPSASYNIQSVDASAPGIVLVTSDDTSTVRELFIDGSGNITDPGLQTLSFNFPTNVVVAPGGTSGVVVAYNPFDGASGAAVESFTISPTAGLSEVNASLLSQTEGISAAFNPAGNMVYVMSNGDSTGDVDAFTFNPSSGAMGTSPSFSIPTSDTSTSPYGVDPLAVSEDGTQLYVADDGLHQIDVYNAANGNSLGSISNENLYFPLGMVIGDITSYSAPSATTDDTATVSDPAVVLAGLNSLPLPTISEGQSTGTVQLGTFTDPGGPENTSDYNATIDWGDGTTSAGTITPNYAGGTAITGLTGFNQDVVFDNAGDPVSQSFDGEGNNWYQNGLDGNTTGLPQSFTSNFGTPFTFQSFTGNNVLMLGNDNSDSGTLTLTTPAAYSGIAVLAASADSANPASGTFTIYFADGSNSGPLTYDATDWSNTDANAVFPAGSIFNASGSATPSSPGTFNSVNFPVQMFETRVDLASLGDAGKAIQSISFNVNSSRGETGIFAVSGTTSFAVTGSHTYVEESSPDHGATNNGVFNIGLSVNHEGQLTPAAGTAPAASITVTDPAVVINPQTVVNYGDFAAGSNLGQISVNGSANDQNFRFPPAGDVLQLTDGFGPEAGSAWLAAGGEGGPATLSTTLSFGTQFQFLLHGGSTTPGDGITFAIQNDPNGSFAEGYGGAALGFGGIQNSLAVGFESQGLDTPGTVAIFTDGSLTPLVSAPIFPLYGAPVNIWVDYDAGTHTLSVFASQTTTEPATPVLTTTIDLATIIDSSINMGWVGFTGGTDGTDSAVQEIQNWHLTQPYLVTPEGAATATQTLATFTDPGGPEATTDYNATLAWGDTTTSTGTVVPNLAAASAAGLGGFNQDVVYEAGTQFPSVSQPFGAQDYGGGLDWFQSDAQDYGGSPHLDGLSPSFVSNDGTPFSFQSFDGNNVLELGNGNSTTGTLTFNTSGRFSGLAILAASADDSTPGDTGSLTINFADGSTYTTSYNASDWTDITDPNAALPSAVGRAINFFGEFIGETPAAQMFETDINLAALGLTEQAIDSITFTAAANAGETGIFAVSGTSSYAVQASHTYAEEEGSPFQVSLTVNHDSGVISGPTQIATVAVTDPPLTHVLPPYRESSQQTTEGTPTKVALARFHDTGNPNGDINSEDYTADVNWGDGTGLQTNVPLTIRYDAQYQAFTVYATHTFVEESTDSEPGFYMVTTQLHHEDTADPAPVTVDVTVDDQQLMNLASANLPATGLEGAPLGTIAGIATFTDPAGTGDETASGDFTATIDWGDGTSSSPDTSPGTVISLGNGNYTVDAPNHTCVEEGQYTVTVTLQHDEEPALNAPTQVITILDQQITNLVANVPTTGLEGAPVSPITGIATFTDPAGVGVETANGDFTATINWGDGTTSAGNVVSLGGGNYQVNDPNGHTYTEEGTYEVTVIVTHDLLPAVSSNERTITISDQQITRPTLLTDNLPPNMQEGLAASVYGGEIAMFSDPAGTGVETAADFTATINWGDGTTSPGTVVLVGAEGAAQYQVDAPAHTYVEEGNYNISVTVQHDGMAPLTSATHQVTVADQQVTGVTTANLPATGLEGAPLGTIADIATFFDPAGAGVETSADFTATINWGDGTSSSPDTSPGTVHSLGGGNYSVNAPTHTYAEEGTYTVSVTIKHDMLSPVPAGNTQTIVIADQPITGLVEAKVPATGLEGAKVTPITAIATFTDPAGAGAETAGKDFTATIDWGDGTTSGGNVVSLGGGNYQVNDPNGHTYTEEGTYEVTVIVTHDALPPVTSNERTIAISDQQITRPVLTGALPTNVQEGVLGGAEGGIATFGDPAGVGDETAADFTATINWGDGTTSPGTVVLVGTQGAAQYEVDAPAHTYVEEGKYNLSVTVQHDALAPLTSASQQITVADQQVTNVTTANLPATGLVGAPLGTVAGIATFTDPAGAGVETGADFTATINWGDGTSSSADTSLGTVIPLGGGNYTVDAPNHTYTSQGMYTVSVTVQHEGLTPVPASNTQTIVIGSSSNVTPDTATKLVIVTGPSTVGAGQYFTFQVDVEDKNGNVVTTDSSLVHLALTGGAGFSSGQTVIQAAGGVASFVGLSIQLAGGPYTLTFTDPILTQASAQLTVTAGPAFKLVYAGVPSAALADLPVPTFSVDVEDQFNNIVKTDSSQVTVAVTGPAGSTPPVAPVSVNANQGVAIFSNILIEALGNFSLFATDNSLVPASFSPMLVTFQDNFHQPNGSLLNSTLWTVHLGSPMIENNSAVGTGRKNYAVANNIVQRDVIVTGMLTVGPSTAVRQGGGLIARSQLNGEGNYYYGALFLTKSGGLRPSIRIMHPNGKVLKVLTSGATIPATSGVVEFEVVGSSLKLFFKGNLVASAHDSTLGAGSVGFRVNPGSSWSNFVAAAVGDPVSLPFSDNFSQPSAGSQLSQAWTDQQGNFTIHSGIAVGTEKANVAVVNGPFVSDVTVEATLADMPTGLDAGLVARYSGSGSGNCNYYMGSVVRKGNALIPEIFLHKAGSNGGKLVLLKKGAAISGAAVSGTTVKFVLSGTSLQLFVNGNLAASATNTTLTDGTVGMQTNKGGGWSSFSAQ